MTFIFLLKSKKIVQVEEYEFWMLHQTADDQALLVTPVIKAAADPFDCICFKLLCNIGLSSIYCLHILIASFI